MSARHDTAATADDCPPGYEPAEVNGLGDRRWVHRETGLAVDLFRYARDRTPDATGVPDWYEYQLVIRPDGPDGRGVRVGEQVWERDAAERLAREWMREHPGGRFDGGEA